VISACHFCNIVNSDTGRCDKHVIFYFTTHHDFYNQKNAWNRYCGITFVVVECELSEKNGVIRRGGGLQDRGRDSKFTTIYSPDA
jgi:hypothetical protein